MGEWSDPVDTNWGICLDPEKELRDLAPQLLYAERKGKAEGITEGESKKAVEIARNMSSLGADVNLIKAATHLTDEELEEVQKDLLYPFNGQSERRLS